MEKLFVPTLEKQMEQFEIIFGNYERFNVFKQPFKRSEEKPDEYFYLLVLDIFKIFQHSKEYI